MREQKYKYIIETGKGLVTEIYTLDEIEKGKVNVLNYSAPRKIIARLEFTGLKDKNGVEIYESDIVKAIWSNDCEEYIANEQWMGDVFFNYGSFDINGEWCVALNCFNGTLEVIGNIYENRELLESK